MNFLESIISEIKFLMVKFENLIAWVTSAGLGTTSLFVRIDSVLQTLGFVVAFLIGLLQLRKQWRDRNK